MSFVNTTGAVRARLNHKNVHNMVLTRLFVAATAIVFVLVIGNIIVSDFVPYCGNSMLTS